MAERSEDPDGFLLIEVLAALVVLALVAGYAFHAFSDVFGWLDRNRHRTTALAIARAALDRIGNDIIPQDGHASGQTPDGYTWRVDVAPYEAIPVPASSNVAGYLVEVTVGWRTLGMPRQVHLTTLRLGQRQGA